MERLIFATGNEGKMREIRDILADTYPDILSMKEAGIRTDIAEDGKTYEENALIKAGRLVNRGARAITKVTPSESTTKRHFRIYI